MQEVAVVDHYAAGVGDAPRAGVRLPVQPPHGGAVLEMKVSHRVQGVAPSFLSVQVPGAKPHEHGFESADQALGTNPLTGADEPAQGLQSGGAGDGSRHVLHLHPLLLGEELRGTSFFLVLGQSSMKPHGEAGYGRQTGELGHVGKLALHREVNTDMCTKLLGNKLFKLALKG